MGRIVTKSIAIIGEGETMRIARRYPFKVAPDFPQHSDINHILKPVELRQYIGLKLLITTFFILVSKKTAEIFRNTRTFRNFAIDKYCGCL